MVEVKFVKDFGEFKAGQVSAVSESELVGLQEWEAVEVLEVKETPALPIEHKTKKR